MSQAITYTFSFPAQSSLVVTTSDTPQSVDINGVSYQGYAVESVSGTFYGSDVTGLIGTGGVAGYRSDIGAYDDTLFVNDTQGDTGSTYGIDNQGVAFNTASGNAYDLFSDNGTFGYETGGVNYHDAVLTSVTCFCGGTKIETVHSYALVEQLRVGDLIVTASGGCRPVKWIGHREIDCRTHVDPQAAWPVRIAAHAFGENRPSSDLFVSPGHAICVDVIGEVLIPAAALVNGSTIMQVEVDTVTYWHVELDSHDVILANGLPAESYLDLGNRSFFAESSLVALDAVPDPQLHTEADYCRPLIKDGTIIAAVQERLRARALAMGWTSELDSDPDLRILADGKTIRPEVAGGRASFALPAKAREVWLVSRTFQPSQFGSDADTRTLGVRIKSIAIGGSLAEHRIIDASEASLSIGFHTVEQEASGESFRWTGGRALLPASLWAGCTGQLLLQVAFDAHQYGVWAKPACVHDDASQVGEAA